MDMTEILVNTVTPAVHCTLYIPTTPLITIISATINYNYVAKQLTTGHASSKIISASVRIKSMPAVNHKNDAGI